jgi:hypothetical protein
VKFPSMSQNRGEGATEGRALWAARYPAKIRAGDAVRRALKLGRLARLPCLVCGADERIHAHHPDYAKPLDVMWLCEEHHRQWHRENGPGLNGGIDTIPRQQKRDSWAHMLEMESGIWSDNEVARLETEIRDAIAEELGFMPEPRLFPGADVCWDGSGIRAVAAVEHDGDECSFEEIGEAIGVTREAARLVFIGAMEVLSKRATEMVRIKPRVVTMPPQEKRPAAPSLPPTGDWAMQLRAIRRLHAKRARELRSKERAA